MSLKINKPAKRKEVSFYSLKIGDTFKYNEHYYIKCSIDHSSNTHNYFCFDNGNVTKTTNDFLCIPVNLELQEV